MEGKVLQMTEEKNTNTDLREKVWLETKKLWRIAFPSMLTKVIQFGTLVVTQAFIGRIGQLELAAYSLMQIISIRFGQGTLIGMSSATETLCGQAFGAKQYHMMGIYLQRSWIINLGTATFLVPFFVYSPQIFKVIGQKEDIANKAGNIALWFILYLYSLVFSHPIQKFLQTQLKNMVFGWISAISFGLHFLLSWIFVLKFNLGIPGAMGAMMISSWFVVIGGLVYVLGGWCPETWTGFSLVAFTDLFSMLTLIHLWPYALLGVMVLWCFSLNGRIHEKCQSGHFCFVHLVRSESANELGRGDAKAAKFANKVILATAFFIGIVLWILCLAVGSKIGYLFTNEEAVAKYVSSLSVLLAFSVLLNSFQAVFTGTAIGSGRQSMVAYVNIFSYYIAGVPLGILLGFVFHLRVKGIWLGMIIGVVLQVVLLAYITSITNWEKQVKNTTQRLTRFYKSPEEFSGKSTPEIVNA